MYALMSQGEFVRAISGPGVTHEDGSYTINLASLSKAERMTMGIYDFVVGLSNPPAGKKAQGHDAPVVDHVAGTVTEVFAYVDMTDDEAKEAHNRPIDNAMLNLEKQAIEQGLLRLAMEDLYDRAIAKAAALLGEHDNAVVVAHLTNPEGPFYTPAFAKLKANIDARDALRETRI